jgi:TolB-like protein/class 3 adenylate cyclase
VAREQRKLAAIVAADVVGYSRLMGRDESGTLARLRKNRSEHLDPVLAKYSGRLVKLTGDGALIEFASAVDALSAAIEFQQAMAEANFDQPADMALVFRMGLHLGDLIVDGDDLYGDGVNVAARLEGEASAGGILISRNVRDAVAARVKATFEDLGSLSLKNIERPVRAFRVHWGASDWRAEAAAEVPVAPAALPYAPTLPLPDKPSIAVLPFQNMSADPEQEYFVDGLVEDIITGLSRFKSLFVIARNSSFTYKGKVVDIRQVGRELGVRYVLEGSVRKASSHLRITGQLIDAMTGTHLWADRFDGIPDDVFDLQDQVTTKVVSAIAPKLEQAEIERAKRKPVGNLDAYDCYLRGVSKLAEMTKDGEEEARHLFYRAIALEPGFATPYAMAARCYSRRKAQGWVADKGREQAEVKRLASRISVIGRDDALALCIGGFVLGYVAGDLEDGAAMIDQATALNPNLAMAWLLSGYTRMFLGEHDLAIEPLMRSLRLSPLDPDIFNAHMALAQAHMCLGGYAEASSWAEKLFREQPNHLASALVAAASHALAGRMEHARKAMGHARQLDPALRVSTLPATSHRLPEDFARYVDGLRKAGLPE